MSVFFFTVCTSTKLMLLVTVPRGGQISSPRHLRQTDFMSGLLFFYSQLPSGQRGSTTREKKKSTSSRLLQNSEHIWILCVRLRIMPHNDVMPWLWISPPAALHKIWIISFRCINQHTQVIFIIIQYNENHLCMLIHIIYNIFIML